MDNNANDIEEIEFDMEKLNEIIELLDKASLVDEGYIRDYFYQRISILTSEIIEMSGDLTYKIKVKLRELLGLNYLDLSAHFNDDDLYGIFSYETNKTGFVGYICILESEFIVLETKDGFVYPLFKIKSRNKKRRWK